MPVVLERLRRLQRIRRLAADQAGLELELAAASLRQAEQAQAAQGRGGREARSLARQALALGERSDWLMAEAAKEVAGWNLSRLQSVREQRAIVVEPARQRYIETHREAEQARTLLDSARTAERTRETRKEQAAVDDWFSRKAPKRHR